MTGGNVRGGRIVGRYPNDLTPESPLNTSGNDRVRFLPTTSWDSIWNGVFEWLGVEDATDLDYCLPNRHNTASPVENGGDFPLFTKSDLFDTIM
jgi:uncharacterized protein (DUF1501 family)